MEELFGLSMNLLMVILLVIFLGAMAVLSVLAWRNRIMLKLGLRPIPRRWSQTILIVVGVMLSTVIVSAAFGTGDALSFTIRNEAITSLKTIDEIIILTRADADESFGRPSYIPYERFEQLQRELTGLESIDGLTPQIAERVPAINLRTSLSEARMNVVGLDPSLLQGFGTFTLTSGQEARMEDLAGSEVYITDRAAEELDAVAGDELQLFVGDDLLSVSVKGVIERGGLAGRDPTMLLPLDRAQSMFDKAGQINLIVVSNKGDQRSGVELSEEVTRHLRGLFVNRTVASQLKRLLNQEAVLKALEERQESLSGNIQTDVGELRQELQREEVSSELISLLADDDVGELVMGELDQEELRDVQREAATLFSDLAEFRVLDVKRDFLDAADEAGSFVTTFFITFSSFSIVVGILLIFLIFVMLAAARRSEMGMARAVGAKRRHLVQMFTFEGTAYALVSAAVGVLLGLAVSAGMIFIINRLVAGFGDDFQISIHFEMRTIIVSYCLGMVITFATVAFSANRVSHLNIVAAVRGLPTPIVISTTGLLKILLAPWLAFPRPFPLAWRSIVNLATLHPLRALTLLLQTIWAIAFIPWSIIKSISQVSGRFFMQGWLAFLLGLGLAIQGATGWERDAPFAAGISLMVIGLGLMLRTALKRTSMRADVRDRIAFTFMGVVTLAFWVLPYNALEFITGNLQGGFEMIFVSGISMVTAAVWTVMYNADLLLRALNFSTGRIGKLRPIVVTAVAYPMSARFRTGLTVAMFSLVIFTLMVMSVLFDAFSISATADVDTLTAGWDIEGEVNPLTPFEDIRQAINEEPDLDIEDFKAIGGYTQLDIQVRQVGAENQRWHGSGMQAANDDYLEATDYKFKLIADGYGTTSEEVRLALRSNSNLAVLSGWEVPTEAAPGEESFSWLEGLYYEDDKMSPIDIEVREPRTGEILHLKVIAVLDRGHKWLHEPVITSKTNLDNVIPFPVPITHYRFRVTEGVNKAQATRSLEASFLEHGMETEDLEEHLVRDAASFRAFSRLFTGFMGLGLVVGIAALGVVSTRAVVERRQHIGVLRAIGYRRRMIQLSFMLEFSFIALLGIVIGVVMGLILSYHAISEIRAEEAEQNIRWVVPWLQIGLIIAGTYLFSLAATFLPARRASRIYPAEALRYE